MQQLIEELKLADATLENDGYKSWCYTRLAIDQAIDVLQKQALQQCNVMRAQSAEPLPPFIPCGGCGADHPSQRCLGCLHQFGGNGP